MSSIYRIVLCAVVIVMIMTAGCILSRNTTGVSPLITVQETPAATPVPSAAAPAGTTQPGAAVTQASGTCPADVSSDPANCGGCGIACPANALCQAGQCYCNQGYTVQNNQCVPAPAGTSSGNGCPSGMSPCPDGNCYELDSSPANCGMCGNVCPSGLSCVASTCTNTAITETTAPVTTTAAVATTTTAAPIGTVSGLHTFGPVTKSCFLFGLTDCSGSCVNTTSDGSNCGSCGTKCTGPLMGCCKSTCTSYASDASNCGSCGHKCSVYSICSAGSCTIKSVVTFGTVPKITAVLTPIYQQPVVLPGI